MGRTVVMAQLRESAGALHVVSRDSVASFTAASLSDFDLMYDVGASPNELFVAAGNEQQWQLVFAQNWIAEARRRLAAAHN